MSEITIRKAKLKDVQKIIELALELMQSHVKFDGFSYAIGSKAKKIVERLH